MFEVPGRSCPRPASRPCRGRARRRSSTISSTVAAAIAVGDVFGRRERGSNAASPSRRQRADELVDPRPGHPVGGRHLRWPTALDNNSSDHQTSFRHPATSEPAPPPDADAVRHDLDVRPGCPEPGHCLAHRLMSQAGDVVVGPGQRVANLGLPATLTPICSASVLTSTKSVILCSTVGPSKRESPGWTERGASPLETARGTKESRVQAFFSGRWPEWVRVMLLMQLAVAAAFQLTVSAISVVWFSVDVPSVLTTLLWFGASIISALAFLGIFAATRPDWPSWRWWPGMTLVAEVIIILLSMYAVYVDVQSLQPDPALYFVLGPLLLPALIVLLPLVLKLPTSPKKAWAAVAALVPLLGLLQFAVQNQILPSRSRPQISITASLTEIGRSPGLVHMRGRIDWENKGPSAAVFLASLATVVARRPNSDIVATEPPARLDEPMFARMYNPLGNGSSYQAHLGAGFREGVVWSQVLSSLGSFIPPGLSYTDQFTFDVGAADPPELMLTVEAVLLPNRRLNRWHTCDQGTKESESTFVTQARKVWTSSAQRDLQAEGVNDVQQGFTVPAELRYLLPADDFQGVECNPIAR